MPSPLIVDGRVVRDIGEVIAHYRPYGAPGAAWPVIGGFVRDVVTRAAPTTWWGAQNWMITVGYFVAWAHVDEHMPLDVEGLFTPDRVERYMAVGMPRLSAQSRATRRAALSTIGPRVTRRAPWPPPRQAIERGYLADPYDAPTVARYWEVAGQQKTGLRQRAATALLACGLGAGLAPAEHLRVYGGDVRSYDGVLVIHVPRPGREPRLVPVLHRYADVVADLAAEHPDEPLVGRRGASKDRLNTLVRRIELPPGLPALQANRLRSTWMVNLLGAGVPLWEFLAVAGLATTRTLEDLLPFVPHTDGLDALRLVAGALP